jgi:ABC-2 type transport system ATP-binding protein
VAKAVTAPGEPLEAERLCRNFGEIRAVIDLSFKVGRGEVVGLLGPNGAGKTTTLRMLTGTLVPTSGLVRLSGRDVFREGAEARARLGSMPEQLALYGEMTVEKYLRFIGDMKGLEKGNLEAGLARVRGRLTLDEVWGRPTRALSRGYRQRVGLAQALLGEPDVLILDEPTTGLDPNQIREFRALLRALGKDHAILLSTHILGEAIEVCDRVMILHRGRLVASDRPERLAGAASGGRNAVGRVRMPDRPDLGGHAGRVEPEQQAGVWRVEGAWSEEEGTAVMRLLVEQGGNVLDWRSSGNALEEVFRSLTVDGEQG